MPVSRPYNPARYANVKDVLALAACLEDRIAELEDALRRVVLDVNDYERVNNLSPNPGRSECWDSVANAKTVLANPWT